MKTAVALVFALSLIPAARAEVRLPSLFSDHMALDRTAHVPIWGWADPNEAVRVRLAGKTVTTVAMGDGKWKLALDLSHTGPGPFQMEISGKNMIAISDVVVGQVWLASGQSNMDLTLKETQDAGAEIARSANPLLRFFHVRNVARDVPADDCEGRWEIAGPQTSPNFSAIGYYFGKRLQADLQQPVGIIDAAWGGTIIEAWTSASAIASMPTLKAEAEARHKVIADFPVQRAAFTQAYQDWQKSSGREDRVAASPALFAGESVTTDGWSTLLLPGPLTAPGLATNGAMWLRREVDLPPVMEKLNVGIGLGRITGFQTVYWNGKKVAETTPKIYPGAGHVTYFGLVPAQIHPGKNILAVRIYCPRGTFCAGGRTDAIHRRAHFPGRSVAGQDGVRAASAFFRRPRRCAQGTASRPGPRRLGDFQRRDSSPPSVCIGRGDLVSGRIEYGRCP